MFFYIKLYISITQRLIRSASNTYIFCRSRNSNEGEWNISQSQKTHNCIRSVITRIHCCELRKSIIKIITIDPTKFPILISPCRSDIWRKFYLRSRTIIRDKIWSRILNKSVRWVWTISSNSIIIKTRCSREYLDKIMEFSIFLHKFIDSRIFPWPIDIEWFSMNPIFIATRLILEKACRARERREEENDNEKKKLFHIIKPYQWVHIS